MWISFEWEIVHRYTYDRWNKGLNGKVFLGYGFLLCGNLFIALKLNFLYIPKGSTDKMKLLIGNPFTKFKLFIAEYEFGRWVLQDKKN